MPIINGQKMAWYVSLLLPLNIAIPKKQKCGCPPETGGKETSTPQDRSPTDTPASPTRSAFRVTKGSSNSRAGMRKQTFDPANLSRVDPMSVNLVMPTAASLDATTMAMISNGIVTQVSPHGLSPGFDAGVGFVTSPGGAFSPTSGFVYGAPLSYDMSLQYTQAHAVAHHEIKTEETIPPPISSTLDAAMPPPPFANGGKHSRSSSLNGHGPPLLELGPSPVVKANGATSSTPGSCCGGGSKEVNALSTPQTDFEKPFVPDYLKQPGLGNFAFHPTVFTYPANYGSWQHPINPEIWQQVASQPNMSVDAPLAITSTNGTPEVFGTSHECSCGEGCQCVGCLAHPFNDQMFQYVNNAYTESTANGNGNNISRSGSGSTSSCCGNGDRGAGQGRTPVAAPESPPEAQTPSEGSLNEEQSLSTVDYFFVNIPLRMDGSCGGNINSCPCGDDCECIGCLVHNAPVPE
ncbi:hypothetical protein OQA88_9651 [Cercophora sp. LCS_1]